MLFPCFLWDKPDHHRNIHHGAVIAKGGFEDEGCGIRDEPIAKLRTRKSRDPDPDRASGRVPPFLSSCGGWRGMLVVRSRAQRASGPCPRKEFRNYLGMFTRPAESAGGQDICPPHAVPAGLPATRRGGGQKLWRECLGAWMDALGNKWEGNYIRHLKFPSPHIWLPKRLQVHGLISKVPRSRRWTVSSTGYRIMGTVLAVYHEEYQRFADKMAS